MDLPYVLIRVYDAHLERVWQALTDQDAMKTWYFPQLRRFEPLAGFEMEFEDDGSTFKKHWQVTQVLPGRKLAHTWIYMGYPGVSEVIFELFLEGDKTRLKLTHSGLSSFPNDPHFARHRFEEGWKSIIGIKLKHYLEQGNGSYQLISI
jgi:uncharacterized protein YndB with AHSA1/START domain